MSRERCLSLDRTHRRQQDNLFQNGFYFPESSPNRTFLGPRSPFAPQHAPSTPDIYRRNYGGAGRGRSLENIPMDDLPNETLDDYEEPSFQNLVNRSFDEIRCILASPPRDQEISAPSAAQQLDALITEVAEVIEHSRMVNEPTLCPHKIPPLPEDPHDIPPPPKNKKDVVAIIRRAKAIARVKAIEEAKAPSKPTAKRHTRGVTVPKRPMKQVPTLPIPKSGTTKPMRQVPTVPKPKAGTTKPIKNVPACPKPKAGTTKPIRNVPAGPRPKPSTTNPIRNVPPCPKPKPGPTRLVRKLPPCPKLTTRKPIKQVPSLPKPSADTKQSLRQAPTVPKPKTATTKPVKQLPTCPKPKSGTTKPMKQVPTLPKPKAGSTKITKPVPPCPKSKSVTTKPIKQVPTLPKPKAGTTARPKTKVPTCPKSKASISKQAPVPKPSPRKPPDPQTFEGVMQRVSEIRERSSAAAAIALVKRNISTHAPQDEFDDLDEFEALEELYEADRTAQSVSIVESVTSLQVRIDYLQQQLLHSPPGDDFEALEQQSGPTEYDANLQERCPPSTSYDNIDVSDFNINDISQFAFSAEAMENVVFRSASEISFGEIPGSDADEPQPQRQRVPSPSVRPPCPPLTLDDALDNIDFPDFNINDISAYAFSAEAMANFRSTSEISFGEIPDSDEPLQRPISPIRPRVFNTPMRPCPSLTFDDAVLENINIPEFDINDLSQYAFSAEANADFGRENSLFDAMTSDLDELSLQDEGAPDLRSMSTSDDQLAVDPDCPSVVPTEEDEDAITAQREAPQQVGFLTAIVNAVVDSFRSMFSPRGSQNDMEEADADLDSSLPNLFETCPEIETSPTLEAEKPIEQKPLSPKVPTVIPAHPKNRKDYAAMVKRAQAIQKKKAEDLKKAKICAPPTKKGKREIKKEKRGKREIKSTIPKRAPPPKKKIPVQKKAIKPKKKVYPPGQYSPTYVKAIAKARSQAGLRNTSEQLNPQIAEELAKRKAAEEAAIAQSKADEEAEQKALDALPLIERMRAQMRKMRESSEGMPRPSIDVLATLEAIRVSVPPPEIKKKWRPTGRLRVDFRVKPSERIFRRDFGRILIPTEKTQKKKGWKELDVMSPLAEEQHEDIHFSPQARLRCLKDQADRRAAEESMRAEEQLTETPRSSRMERFESPEIAQYSPIQLGSPTGPRTEESKRERIVTQIGPHGGTETIREEVTETSTIENGEVHLCTRQVTTTTDEYGNVTRHVQEGNGLSGEEVDIAEDLSYVEPPDILESSDRPPPRDPSIPSSAEIINRIRSQVQQISDFPQSPRRPSPKSPRMIDLPQELSDNELCDIEIHEFEKSPKVSPQVKALSPVEKDQRMYVLGEVPPPTPPPRSPTPPRIPTPTRVPTPTPAQKAKSPEGAVCVPPHPKNPKDYQTMVKRAQAIQKLRKQQELDAKPGPSKQTKKGGRVPISRWVKPPPKDQKRRPRKKLVLKKRVSKKGDVNEDKDREGPEDLRTLPKQYIDAIARARIIRGFKNRTAALNPKVAAKQAAQEAARAVFEALPENEKIKIRMERLRNIPARKRRTKPSTDILGIIAAIRENMAPIEQILRTPSPHPSPQPQEIPVSPREISPRTPIMGSPSRVRTPQAPVGPRRRAATPSSATDELSDSFYYQQILSVAAQNRSRGASPNVPVQETDDDESLRVPDTACMQPYISPEQVQGTPRASPRAQPCISPEQVQGTSQQRAPFADDFDLSLDLSLSEFEIMETEAMVHSSLGEFEFLEAEAEAEAEDLYYYETPKTGERYFGRQLIDQFPSSPRRIKTEPCTPPQQGEIIDLVTPSPVRQPPGPEIVPSSNLLAPASRMLNEAGYFEEIFEQASLEEMMRPMTQSEMFRALSPRIDYTGVAELFNEPINLQERFQRLRERQSTPSRLPEQSDDSSVSPTPEYSPIILQPTDEDSIRQLVEDMSIDNLEFEQELCLSEEVSMTGISSGRSSTPRPRSEEIIRRIEATIHQQLRERTHSPARPVSPEILSMPEDLPYEELTELSPLSLPRTPQTPQRKDRSRVSLPMAYGEVRPATPVTPVVCPPRTPTPIRAPTPCPPQVIKQKIPSPEGHIVIPPHPKDRKDTAAMVKRAQAIHKLQLQEQAKAPPQQEPPKKMRQPISRWVGGPPKKISTKPKKKLVLKKPVPKPVEEVKKKVEKPLLPKKPKSPRRLRKLSRAYIDPVARARSIQGLRNTTAALNPEYVKKLAEKKAAKEAAIAAYNALPEFKKIEVRMKRLRKRPQARRIKPTMEQMAYLEALKQSEDYGTRTAQPHVEASPRELAALAQFEALEKLNADQVCPPEVVALEQGIDDVPRIEITPPEDEPETRPAASINLNQLILTLEEQHFLRLPSKMTPVGKYRQLLARRKTPKSPVISPVTTPEIHYSPVQLHPGSRGRTVESDSSEDLEQIQEPNLTPTQRSRSMDIIESVRQIVKEILRPEEPRMLRGTPRKLSFPAELSEEEVLDYGSPELGTTSPQSPTRSPVRSADVSLPQVFEDTPPHVTPPPPASPPRLKRRSPARQPQSDPTVIPPHPKNPNDIKALVKRAKKIQELLEKEYQVAKQKEAAAATAAANKAKRKERVPISRWTAPPPRKPAKGKKLVMKKRTVAATAQPTKQKCPAEPPQLSQQYAQQVAKARKLAGLKNRTAALNPKTAAREAARAAAKAAKEAARNAPPPSPAKDYDTVLSRMEKIKSKGIVARGQPSMQAVAYLGAVKEAIQIHQEQQQQQQHVAEGAHYESPRARYERVLASRSVVAPTIEESPIRTPSSDNIAYSPVRYDSPHIDDGQIDLSETLRRTGLDAAALEILNELQQPSDMELSESEQNEDQNVPVRPTRTMPPIPRIVIHNATICPESPAALNFPEELPDGNLLQVNAPVYIDSPVASEPPSSPVNISLPHLFERSPSPVREKTPTPKALTPRKSASPTAAVCLQRKVKTPEGPIKIPPHPKNPKDRAAMIKRAQAIQKLKAKEDAEKITAAKAAKAAKTRVPISRRVPAKPVQKKEPMAGKVVPKKKYGGPSTKAAKPRAPKECPKEPPKLNAKYLEQIAKARKMAGLKSRKVCKQKAKAKSPLPSAPTEVKTTTPSYTTVVEKYVLRTGKKKEQKAPTGRELAQRQRLKNLQQKEARKQLFAQLEQLRQQEVEFEPRTPPGAHERLEAIKARAEASAYYYSPVRTPDVSNIEYEALTLPRTPPYQFQEVEDGEDIANIGFMEMENDIAELDRIEMQEDQRIDSPNRAHADMANRIEILQNQIIASANRNNENALEEYNIAARMRQLEMQLLEAPTQQEPQAYTGPDAEEEQYDEDFNQNNYDEFMDDFEAMERECL